MNIKLKEKSVIPIIGTFTDLRQMAGKASELQAKASFIFPEPQAGNDYYQWNLAGNDWTKLVDLDGDVQAEYQWQREQLQEKLKNSPLRDVLLGVPSNDFIYARSDAEGNWTFALTAWGFKYSDKAPGGEIVGKFEIIKRQQVTIGFKWGDRLIPNYDFKLNGQPRTTGVDGWFKIDKPLEVGTMVNVETADSVPCQMCVEEGKEQYEYDVTIWFQVNVTVLEETDPIAEAECEVDFNGEKTTIVTDQEGKASLKLMAVSDIMGKRLENQPECVVRCREAEQTETPDIAQREMSFLLTLKKTEPEPEIIPEPEPEPKPEKEPELVSLLLLDYGGKPLKNMNVTISQKKKEPLQLTTDEEGRALVEKSWLTPGKKLIVNFNVTPEYQKEHDIYLKKSENDGK